MTDENGSIERLIEAAEQRFRYGDAFGAIECLKEALSFAPDNAFLHSYLSYGLVATKRLGAALHEAQLGLSMEPYSPFAHYALGNVWLVKQKYRQSIEHLNIAISLEPDNSNYLLAQSRCLQALKDKTGALEALDQALSLAP
ncbi:MAG: hypothetical protein MJK04_03990, partial [Psychrosphaera sp.]|nr:hypothetical protein [Psychrosphaera sp.]